MGWKNWSYWLRGGIIGLFVCLVFIILTYLTLPIFGNFIKDSDLFWRINNPLDLLRVFWFIITFPILMGVVAVGLSGWGNPSGFSKPFAIIALLIVFAVYFIIGVIIGWIVGKIKSRRNNLQQPGKYAQILAENKS